MIITAPNKLLEKVLSANKFLNGRQKVINALESKIFLMRKLTQCRVLTVLPPKQIFQRLPIAFAQVKAGDNICKFVRLYIFCIDQRKLVKSI